MSIIIAVVHVSVGCMCNAVCMCSPDVGISIPVQNMVENALEKNGPKILLPQIVDAVTALQDAAQKTTDTTDSSTPSSGPTHKETSAPMESVPGKSGNSELSALDLPLPIIIPGLNAGGGGDSGVKAGNKKESTAEQPTVKAKPKPKTTSDCIKEAKGAAKTASQKGSSAKVVGSKPKEDKSLVDADEKEEGKEAPQPEDGSSKEKGRGTGASGKVKRVSKEEKVVGQREKESEKQPEKKVSTKEKETAASDLDQKDGVRTEVSGREKEVKERPKPELKSEAATEQTTEQEQVGQESDEDEVEETKGSIPASSGGGGGSSSRRSKKQQLPVSKRRSARLASLNEGSSDEQEKISNGKAKSSSNNEDLSREDTGKSIVPESGKKRVTPAEKPKSSDTASSRAGSGRKRLRVLESSSDEDTVKQMSSEDEEKGYESETELQQEEEEEEVGGKGERVRGKRRKRKRARAQESVTGAAQQSQTTSLSSRGLAGQKRSLGASKEDQGVRRSSSPASKKVKTRPGGKQLQEERKLSPAKQKSPSPIVTRYLHLYHMKVLEYTSQAFCADQDCMKITFLFCFVADTTVE